MDTNNILDLLDDDSKSKAFKNCFIKLENAPQLDLDTLKVCVKLRPLLPLTPYQLETSWQAVEGYAFAEKLCHLVLLRMPHEQLYSDRIYKLAEIVCSDGPFANKLIREKLYPNLAALLPELSILSRTDIEDGNEADWPIQHTVRIATAYLTLLKCSYWLPSESNHVIDPSLLKLLSNFVGLSQLDEVAHDTISALLSLLKRREPIVVAPLSHNVHPWLKMDPVLGQLVLAESLVDTSIWDRLSVIEPRHYITGKTSSKVFRTWFQWVSQAVVDNVQLNCLQNNSYWEVVRAGLLHGHADHRKYCLGIIRQSLLASQTDISTPAMQFRISERVEYIRAYEQYSAVFETIVFNHYTNQVQACLPELTKVFESVITPLMASTLLSAALDYTVQEGVRKIVGNWYMEYVIKVQKNVVVEAQFLVKGFLPWATTGELFTSTLLSTRDTTFSAHGISLAAVVARCVVDAPVVLPSGPTGASDTFKNASRGLIITKILDFVLDAKGKLFQFATLYLLEGLVEGLRACGNQGLLQELLAQSEIEKISQISRLPGLPEIAGDLYSNFCCQICDFVSPGWRAINLPPYQQLLYQVQRLIAPINSTKMAGEIESCLHDPLPLKTLRSRLEESHHRCIQGDGYALVCKGFINILDRVDPTSIIYADLYAILDAFWEEADRRQFCRSVAAHLPSILFHPTSARVCLLQRSNHNDEILEDDLQALLSRTMQHLQRLSEGRTYILSTLAISIRKAVISFPDLISVLPLEEYILRFLNNPPTTKSEFLFEVAAAEKLQQHLPHRTYNAYYGKREWYAYAAIIDLLHRFPTKQLTVAKRILDSLLQPWKTQRAGVPIISKWKNVLQLQAMLLLTDFCLPASEAVDYLASFQHALVLEAWPRYRFLLEWIIARIYYRFPGKSSHILDDLSRLGDNSSTQIASLVKLAVLVAPREVEHFSATLMIQLVPLSASSKVHIRHESNYAIPIVFDLALSRGWKSIVDNPAFISLNAFIRGLDKFKSPPWTIRTLRLDAVTDFTVLEIFQGNYLSIESPEKQRVTYEDFMVLLETDRASGLDTPPARIPLGQMAKSMLITEKPTTKVEQHVIDSGTRASSAFFQTKSGFDINSLHPRSGPPGAQNQRPASVILVSSLIENPTNLGGLSRISESFGIEALIVDDIKKVAHKDFKATSVTSEKHFPIREVKSANVPEYLLDMRRSGYEVLGIEQTDQSSILGAECIESANVKPVGTLPKKCVLVLGSEKGGIPAEVLAVIDRCVEIRTIGVTRSLNVQTAGAIALYEWWREWYGKD
ncbi:hypothetical protein GQ44DRAFT_751378 [Phaeosphaeriaceae sp. PMI808]|nr:hypothetical protein GQ44DRAFT_751378 [Phaeosphaeriaceae sp. PMI808]